MAIRPVSYKAIIKPEKVEETTKGGIILAVDQGLEIRAQVLGTIIELGEDFAVAYSPKTPYWGLKKGDQIFYAKYAGKWVKDPDTSEEFLIINDEDVCGIYVKEETQGNENALPTLNGPYPSQEYVGFGAADIGEKSTVFHERN